MPLALLLFLSLQLILDAPRQLIIVIGPAKPVQTYDVMATSCSQAHIQEAVDAAMTGQSIGVPAGECTHPTGQAVVIPSNKTLSIFGAGAREGGTVLTRQNPGNGFFFMQASPSRISGFWFKDGYVGSGSVACSRVDHNRFSGITNLYDEGVWIVSTSGAVNPCSVISDNIFDGYRVLVHGSNVGCSGCSVSENYPGYNSWATEMSQGSADGRVFIEGNTFNGLSSSINAIDSTYGGRYVSRFNNFIDMSVEAHSMQGNNRGTRGGEIYRNTYTITGVRAAGYWHHFIRAGTWFIFDNTAIDSSGPTDFLSSGSITLNNVRSDNESAENNLTPFGACDGDATIDSNELATGRLCRDAPGAGKDASAWTSANVGPVQAKEPIWIGPNTVYGGQMPVAISGGAEVEADVIVNLDYYVHSASFVGTTGAGSGTTAARPATCTTGVFYWATDEGEWWAANPGADGRLYKCTATNTWTLVYTPYTYPHP